MSLNLPVKVRFPQIAVVLFSGGLDSAVTMSIAIEHGCQVYPLFFDYGQTNLRELDFAESLLENKFPTAKPLKVCCVDYESLAPQCVMLNEISFRKAEKKSGDFAKTEDISVPNRTVVFLSLAGVYATTLSATRVYTGTQMELESSKENVIHDVHEDVLVDMQRVLQQHSGYAEREVTLHAPLLNHSKSEIVRMAKKRGIQVADTFSCLAGTKTPCGSCVSCNTLRIALDRVGSG